MKNLFQLSPLFILLAVGCNQSQLGDGKAQGKTGQEPVRIEGERSVDQKPEDPNAEIVTPPANITGILLRCAEEVAAPGKTEAMIGCRLHNAQGARVPASSLSQSFLYSWESPSDVAVKVAGKMLTADARYDAIYQFLAANPAALTEGMKRTRILLHVKDAPTGQLTISGLYPEIEVSAAALPEPRSPNYEALSAELLQEIVSAEPSPPLPLREPGE